MKSKFAVFSFVALAALFTLTMGLTWAQASQPPQVTSPESFLSSAFTYQGKLQRGGTPFDGTCDMAFRLYEATSAGNELGVITTTVPISNGLFTISLDFGASAFTSSMRWLDIQVKCSGDSTFTDLNRQALTAAPQALYALSSGALQGYTVLSVTPTLSQVLKWNGSAWAPAMDEIGGNNAAWSPTGNAGTILEANFLGTTDKVSMTLRVSNTIALRLVPSNGIPNVIVGYAGNMIPEMVMGSTIGGGGMAGHINRITANYSTIGGGSGNTASGIHSVIGGGEAITVTGNYATIGGGQNNVATGYYDVAGGGNGNTVSGQAATVSGGEYNLAEGQAATVPGGNLNTAQGDYSFAAGHQAKANHTGSFVWADASGPDFASTGPQQFDVRATGGVNLTVGSANARVNGVPLLSRALAPAPNTSTNVDSVGDVGLYTSLTIGADGLPVVSYYDFSNNDLKILHCGNVDCTSDNTLTPVDSVEIVGSFTSIAIGVDGLPIISYHGINNTELKILHCGNTACTGGNNITAVDSVGIIGQYTSITIGADGLPLVSYYDNGANDDLKVLHCGDTTCSSGNTITTVDSAGDVGLDTSVIIGMDGLPLVSYIDNTNDDLKILHCGNAACTSGNTSTPIDAASSGGGSTSVNIGMDGLPVVSYYDSANGDLKVLHCGNATCTSGNITTTVLSLGNVGWFSSLTIGVDGLPLIGYYDYSDTNLKVLHCGNTTCTSANITSMADFSGDVGHYVSLTIGADGLPVASYYNATSGNLRVLHCSNSFCVPYFRRR